MVEIVAGLMPTYLAFMMIVPLLGFTALTMITAANTTMQLATAPGLRGRVMALYLMVFMGGTPLGSPFIGWIGETFGARWTLIAGGGAHHPRCPGLGRRVHARQGPARPPGGRRPRAGGAQLAHRLDSAT